MSNYWVYDYLNFLTDREIIKKTKKRIPNTTKNTTAGLSIEVAAATKIPPPNKIYLLPVL